MISHVAAFTVTNVQFHDTSSVQKADEIVTFKNKNSLKINWEEA